MEAVTEQIPAWLQQLGWMQTLTAIHYAGIAICLTGVLVGDSLGFRLLVSPGMKYHQRTTQVTHYVVLFGLCLLWSSGSAIAVTKFAADTVPAKIVFKVIVASALSVNAILMQRYLMPLVGRYNRPLASSLPWTKLLATAVIGTTSLVCWIALGSIAFIKELQAYPIDVMFQTFGYAWAIVAAGMLAVMLCVRVFDRFSARARPARDFDDGDPDLFEEVATERGMQGHHTAPTLQHANIVPFSPAGSLMDRLTEAAPALPGNDNPRQTTRERIERGRVQNSRLAAFFQRDRNEQALDKSSATLGDASESAPTKIHSVDDVRKACRTAFAGATGVSFFSNLLMLTGPLFMLQIYDRVLTSKSLPTLTALFLLVVGLFVFMAILDFMRTRILVRIGLRIDRLLSRQVFEHAIRISDPLEKDKKVQLVKDVQQIRQFVSGAGTTALMDMPWAPIYFALVVMFHWMLGVVALVGTVVLVVLSLLNEALSRKPIAQATKHTAECDTLFDTGRRNSETLQSMGMSGLYSDLWVREHSAELASQTKAADVSGLLSVLTKTTRLILQSAMLAMGAYLVLGNEISPGVMIAGSIIMSRALAPIELAISHWRGFIAARQGLQRLKNEFRVSADTVPPMRLPRPEGQVAVQNLFAAPVGVRTPVLKGLNFTLQPGDALGVLGASGSGKSTLARVLIGVCPALRGAVRLDGAALDTWPEEQLGQHIGYLPQNVELLDGTVAQNIARFDPHAEPAAIVAAARLANVHDMTLGLTDGYNTRVGSGGAVLSGGQCQRIALARALYRQPAFVVLDEPNSNLDTDGEQALALAIRDLRRSGCTVVVMAHRKSALEHVNKLLVLHEGRQAAFGERDEILKPKQVQKPSTPKLIRSKLSVAK